MDSVATIQGMGIEEGLHPVARRKIRGRRWNVLLIEADDDLADDIRGHLGHGSTVALTRAADCYEALDLMVERAFDLVLVDWSTNEMPGLSLLRMFDDYLELDVEARYRWGALGKIPVIMLSSMSVRPQDLGFYKSFTVIDVVSKNQDAADVADEIEQNIRALNVVSDVLKKEPGSRRVS